jgi:23S rRNA (uracil1939-C5)-methyltransferase
VNKAALGGRLISYAPSGKMIWLNGVAGLGDQVEAKIIKVHKRSLDAEIIQRKIIHAQPAYQFCEHVEQCAACPWQALSTDEQMSTLTQDIQRSLSYAIKDEVTLDPSWIGAEQGWRYTTRLHWNGNQLGFYTRDHRIFDLKECPILAPTLLQIIADIRSLLLPHVKPHADIRLSCAEHASTGTVSLALKGERNSLEIEALKRYAPRCIEQSNSIHGMSIQAHTYALLQTHDSRSRSTHNRMKARQHKKRGLRHIERQKNFKKLKSNHTHQDLNPIHLQFAHAYNLLSSYRVMHHADSFMQAHQVGNQALVKAVIQGVYESKALRILELYAGSGNLSIALAEELRQKSPHSTFDIQCLEHDSQAVNTLQRVAFERDLPITAHQQNIQTLMWTDYEHIILDPPRHGAKAIMPALGQSMIPHITYISCHPAALARDIEVLVQYGYKMVASKIFHLFPHSGHAEVYVRLSKSVKDS